MRLETSFFLSLVGRNALGSCRSFYSAATRHPLSRLHSLIQNAHAFQVYMRHAFQALVRPQAASPLGAAAKKARPAIGDRTRPPCHTRPPIGRARTTYQEAGNNGALKIASHRRQQKKPGTGDDKGFSAQPTPQLAHRHHAKKAASEWPTQAAGGRTPSATAALERVLLARKWPPVTENTSRTYTRATTINLALLGMLKTKLINSRGHVL